jgi:tetratricopeptide (TPR) repeat protein
MVFENYPFTDRGWYLPAFVPHVIGESINATKGISRGEDIWLSVGKEFERTGIGFNHFMVYFTARMYWGGPDQNVDELFREYCRLFYGPAESEMRSLFEYCEANWQDMGQDKSKVDRTFELLDTAQRKVDPASVFGRRLGLIADYLKMLKNKGQQLARQRGPVPQLRLARDAEGIVIDGQLDDAFWRDAPVHATGRLRELQTGRRATFGTTFQAAWGKDGSIYFAVRCDERPGEPLNIGSTRREDQAAWYGDLIEILLETESHCYYQIAVNPAGAIIDLDRGAEKKSWFGWDSQAEVATRVAEDHWTVEIRIPVVQDENDPLHQVVGRKPISSLPWFFNVCRQRIRESGAEYSAFSPTGKSTFHDTLKFGHLYEGQSHQFTHAELEADFLAARRAALELSKQGKRAETLASLIALAERELTDFQRSDALEQAAACARSLGEFDLAVELAERIPLEPVAQKVRMENLLATRKPQQLIDQFADERLDECPFWMAGEAFFARGRAYASTGHGPAAEADLQAALPLVSDSRTRLKILRTIAGNRETRLKDDDAALETYLQIAAATKNNGSADYFSGVQGAARILTRRGKFDEAIAILRRVDVGRLRGYWRGSMLLAHGETLDAAGRTDEAIAALRAVISDDSTQAHHRQTARERIDAIEASRE